jgi:putative transposase
MSTRRKNFNEPGRAHFLTFSCYRRYQVLADDSACQMLAGAIDRARTNLAFDLWSYVFMPDHVHLLVRPRREQYSVAAILKSIKGSFSRELLADWRARCPDRLRRLEVTTATGTAHRVWQKGGGFDRNLFTRELIRRAILYIEDNPVRRGYVSEATEWTWSGARGRLGKSHAPLPVDEVRWELLEAESTD